MHENNNDTSSLDIYSSEMLKELDKRNKNIRFAITRMDIDVEKASINLYWIYSTKAYKAMGHESIIDYALAEFDISKSTTYNYIILAERFGRRGEDDNLLFDGFDKKYSSYSSSKLNLLAPLTDEEIETLDISPKMSVRDIKKKLKSAKDGYEMVWISPDRLSHKKDISDSVSSEQNVNQDSDSDNNDNESTDDIEDDYEADNNVVFPDDSETKFEIIEDGKNYCSISCYIDEIVNHDVVDSKLWGLINYRYIYDTLKHHPEKSLLIRSIESVPYSLNEDEKIEKEVT